MLGLARVAAVAATEAEAGGLREVRADAGRIEPFKHDLALKLIPFAARVHVDAIRTVEEIGRIDDDRERRDRVREAAQQAVAVGAGHDALLHAVEHFLAVHGVVVREPDGSLGRGRRAGLRENIVEEDVGRRRVELQDRVLDRDGRTDDGRLVDADGARVEGRGRRGRRAVERVVNLRGRVVRAGEHEVERLGLVAVRLGERHRRREVAEALGRVGGARCRRLHVDERAVAGNEPLAGLNRERAVGDALDLLLRREVDLLDNLLARIGELEEFARRGELEDGEGLVRRVLGRVDMDLVEPDDLVAVGGDDARAKNRRLVFLARLRVVGEMPASEVDIHRGAVVELDPVHLGDALLARDAALVHGRVRRHDLVDGYESRGINHRREAFRRKYRVLVERQGDSAFIEDIALGGSEGYGYFGPLRNSVDTIYGFNRGAISYYGNELHILRRLWESQRDLRNHLCDRHVGGGERLVRVHDDIDRRIADKAVADGWRERDCCGSVAIDRVGAFDRDNFDTVGRHGDERHVRRKIAERQGCGGDDYGFLGIFLRHFASKRRKSITRTGKLGTVERKVIGGKHKPSLVVVGQHFVVNRVLHLKEAAFSFQIHSNAGFFVSDRRRLALEDDPDVCRAVWILRATTVDHIVAALRNRETRLDARARVG